MHEDPTHPIRWVDEPGPGREQRRIEPGRDEWELSLIRAALERRLPMLCVCRGAQLLNIALGGTLPVTTHGGLLSACHPGLGGGLFHVLEGVRQVRGQAGARQVNHAKLALVHGNGGTIAIHCTLIMSL